MSKEIIAKYGEGIGVAGSGLSNCGPAIGLGCDILLDGHGCVVETGRAGDEDPFAVDDRAPRTVFQHERHAPGLDHERLPRPGR